MAQAPYLYHRLCLNTSVQENDAYTELIIIGNKKRYKRNPQGQQ